MATANGILTLGVAGQLRESPPDPPWFRAPKSPRPALSERRPMPYPETLKLDFESLFAETVEHIDNRAMGLLVRGLAWAATHKRTYIAVGVMQACGADTNPEDLVTLQRAGFIGERNGAVYPLLPSAWQLCNVGRAPLPLSVRREVLERDSHRCVKCGSRERLQIDHEFPVARGGNDNIENLRTLCQPCNGSKGARV